MKGVGLVLLFALPMGIGIRKYQKLCERAMFWEQFREFLQYAETSVRYAAVPAEILLQRYQTEERNFSLAEQSVKLCDTPLPFPEAWKRATEQVCRDVPLEPAEESFLKRFGDGFGSTDLEGQLAHFRLYAARTDEKQSAAKQEQRQKGKMWLMLGSTAGIGMVLLVL